MPAEPQLATIGDRAGQLPAGWVVVHPRYRRRFDRRGLFTAADFLDLPGDIVNGHADRHVVRVVFGRGLSRLECYLKREHRVRWRERLRNLGDGFGWTSKSEREVRILSELRELAVRVPRWLAYGEDSRGRAFLLILGVPEAVDLRTFLYGDCSAERRRILARRIGAMLARIHATGFNCPDLSSKHVLVRPRNLAPVAIDWQRAVRSLRVRWAIRARELATLNATLAADLATPRERLICLRSYLRRALGGKPDVRYWARHIIHQSSRLLSRRTIRDLRRPPLATGGQRLRWIDGERLVITRPIWRATRGRLPDWLIAAARARVTEARETSLRWRGREVILRQFPPAGPLRRWWNWLRGKHEVAAGPRQGGLLFRLERCRVPGPRPLAFGQRPDGGSFILLRPYHGE
jgi:tRNA A-37 threonylcarbamoyl transferase component Bud32